LKDAAQMKSRDKETVMDGETMERALVRITHEILERNQGVEDLVLIGIRTGGVYLAERIREKIEQIEKVKVPSESSTLPFTGTTSPSGSPARLSERRKFLSP
jgi:hypoxanthine-guanine phosphoribosyltransferase